MRLRNPFLYLPKSLWRVVKTDSKGTLYLHEADRPLSVQELPALTAWQRLQKNLTELPPAFVDILFLENDVSHLISFKTLLKIMNSDGLIVFPESLKDRYKAELQAIGFKFDKKIEAETSGNLLIFKKDVIPCCGS